MTFKNIFVEINVYVKITKLFWNPREFAQENWLSKLGKSKSNISEGLNINPEIQTW